MVPLAACGHGTCNQSTKDQLESRAGLAVPQVERGNEVEWPGGGWLGWEAWVSTSLSDRSDGR